MPDNAWPLVALYCLVLCVRDAPIRRGAHEGANRASRSLIPPRGPRMSRLYVPLAPHIFVEIVGEPAEFIGNVRRMQCEISRSKAAASRRNAVKLFCMRFNRLRKD